MSRLVKTDGVGKQRDRLMKSVAWTLRDLAAKPKLDEDARDMAAYMALALHEIYATIDVTCAAWEKRDYWLKADQFRREWLWLPDTARRLEEILRSDDWATAPIELAGLSARFSDIRVTTYTKPPALWQGAYKKLLTAKPVR